MIRLTAKTLLVVLLLGALSVVSVATDDYSLRTLQEQEEPDESDIIFISPNGPELDNPPCPGTDRCFNNPGFLDGYTMHKWKGFRNLRVCKEYCTPTRFCFHYFYWDASIDDFFICLPPIPFIINIQHFFGWQCGPCPTN